MLSDKVAPLSVRLLVWMREKSFLFFLVWLDAGEECCRISYGGFRVCLVKA